MTMSEPKPSSPRQVLLDCAGGDRSTGYTMSSKILRLPQAYLITWIDHTRRNRCALVDPEGGRVIHSAPLGGQRADNHCGAALALSPNGEVHAIVGGHHTPLEHHLLTDRASLEWQQVAVVGDHATYPSLICDAAGDLHLTYRRRGEPWSLVHCRRRGEEWSPPRTLVRAAVPGYVYWTNALAVGPGGRLHLVFGNTQPRPDGSRYISASHLCSDDGGESWRQLGRTTIPEEGLSAAKLALLGGTDDPSRIESLAHQHEHGQPGPHNKEYMQICLSNPVVDDSGHPCLVLHNGLTGTAALWRHDGDSWRSLPLERSLDQVAPGWAIHQQSALSRRADGRLEALLMVQPKLSGWGAPGTALVRLVIDLRADDVEAEWVRDPDSTEACWLPAVERWSELTRSIRPALLYTVGTNAGGFGNNVNDLRTQVWFELPPEG